MISKEGDYTSASVIKFSFASGKTGVDLLAVASCDSLSRCDRMPSRILAKEKRIGP